MHGGWSSDEDRSTERIPRSDAQINVVSSRSLRKAAEQSRKRGPVQHREHDGAICEAVGSGNEIESMERMPHSDAKISAAGPRSVRSSPTEQAAKAVPDSARCSHERHPQCVLGQRSRPSRPEPEASAP